ncbi:MAG: FlgD immunoglobulin-like domain containing protein, partial [bacterium]
AQCLATVSDDCAGSIPLSEVKIVSISSDEPDDASGDLCINLGLIHICLLGDGATTNDIVIADDCQSAMLRAERSVGGNGRVYTINLQVSDPSGNVATAAYKVSVPPDQCGNNSAADDGPAHTVFGNCNGSALAKLATDGAPKPALEAALLPESYGLAQNFPNPFNPETEIRFQLPEASHVAIKIFSSMGEEIRTLLDGEFAAGVHAVRWNAQNNRGEKVSSGVYFYRLVTPNFTATRRMFLAK